MTRGSHSSSHIKFCAEPRHLLPLQRLDVFQLLKHFFYEPTLYVIIDWNTHHLQKPQSAPSAVLIKGLVATYVRTHFRIRLGALRRICLSIQQSKLHRIATDDDSAKMNECVYTLRAVVLRTTWDETGYRTSVWADLASKGQKSRVVRACEVNVSWGSKIGRLAESSVPKLFLNGKRPMYDDNNISFIPIFPLEVIRYTSREIFFHDFGIPR